MVEALHRQVRGADAGKLLDQDDLLAEARLETAIGFRPVRRDEAALGELAVPRHQLGRRGPERPPAQLDGKILFQPMADLQAKGRFSTAVLAEHLVSP